MEKEDFDFIEKLFWGCYYRSDGMYCEDKAKKIWSDLRKLQLTSDNSDYAKCPKCGSTVNTRETYYACNDDKGIYCDWFKHFT